MVGPSNNGSEESEMSRINAKESYGFRQAAKTYSGRSKMWKRDWRVLVDCDEMTILVPLHELNSHPVLTYLPCQGV